MIAPAAGSVTVHANRTLAVPRGSLPDDAEERRWFLAGYFERLVAAARREDPGWLLELRWPGAAASYVDPELAAGLRWFSPHLRVADIHLGVRLERGFQLALDDAWTLLSWCSWLQQRQEQGETPQALSVLHFDSHADLMSPRLSRAGDRWLDLISGEAVDLRDPPSIVGAIRSGAIGIGSFIVPFLHDVPGLNLFHLCTPSRQRGEAGGYRVAPVFDEGDRLFPGSRRPAVELRRGGGPGEQPCYFLGASLDEVLERVPPGPVLLHLDLDYFNNRFDGRPDWQEIHERHDPSREATLAAIDATFETLAASPLRSRIADVAVALSPGFFPAEFWEPALARVRHGVGLLEVTT